MILIDDANAELLAILVEPQLLAKVLNAYDDVFLSPRVAARLVGRSIVAVRRAVDAGELAAHGTTHRKINLQALAAWNQAPISLERLRPPHGRHTSTTTATVAAGDHGRDHAIAD